MGVAPTGTLNQRNSRCMPEPPGLAPVEENPTEGRERATSQPGRDNKCPHCPSTFATVRGLGVHIASKHRAQRDLAVAEKRDANIKKARWDPEEKRLLAMWEARYTRRGSAFTNADLREKLPHRSLEAIKGQRRKAEHKTLVQDLLRDSPPPSPISAPPTNPEPPGDDPESEPAPPPPGPDPATLAWRRPIIRLFSSMSLGLESEEKNWRADLVAQALAKINKEDPEDPSGDDAACTILQEHAEAILPPGRPHRRGAREPPPAPRTTRQKRREECCCKNE